MPISIKTSLALITTLYLSLVSAQSLAVPGTQPGSGETVGCGSDNICNIGQCSNDPDCPGGSPGGQDDSDPRPSSAVSTIDCTVGQTDDINAAASALANSWNSFEQTVEDATGQNIGNCLSQRFRSNGKVQCVSKYKCHQDGNQTKCKLGFGPGLKKKMKIFQTFFDNVGSFDENKKRGCYAALMMHEFSHTCEHYAEGGPEARAEATLDYWEDRYNVTITPEDCGMND